MPAKSPFLFRFWWMFLFLLLCYGVYLNAVQRKTKTLSELNAKSELLHKDLELALEQNEELLLQIESQSDPAWAELVMMKRLGMVPKGQVKVYFEER